MVGSRMTSVGGRQLLRRLFSSSSSSQQQASETAVIQDIQRPSAPRTAISNPGEHTSDHHGLWYTPEPDVLKRLFGLGGIPKQYSTLCRTFGETSIMVRHPALTTINYIKKSDLQLPPNKFMLYGDDGVGKSISLVHITHFLAQDGWVLLHVPIAPQWQRGFKSIAASSTHPGQYDHPLDATVWLQHFTSQNAHLIQSLQLTTSEQYTWSRRETTEKGEPLMNIAEQGIARARFSSDCVAALTNELKHHASEARCKLAVVVDGINSFFCPESRFRREDRTFVPPENFTLFCAFSHFFNSDWKNGVVVGSIDRHANEGERRKSYLPRYVLRQKGWETLDPFVPIPVRDYDEVEMRSIVDFYLDRRWLQNPLAASETGRNELAALSNHNPRSLMDVCKSL